MIKDPINIQKPCRLVFQTNTGGKLFVLSDSRGKPYYIKDTKPGFITMRMNVITPGVYYSNFKTLGLSQQPIKYFAGPELPKPDRDLQRPFKIVRNKEVQGPARIWAALHPDHMDSTIIETGPMFDTLPTEIQRFIILHEQGHFFYSDEIGADTWALCKFLKEGGNPSQALIALEKYIHYTPANMERIHSLFSKVKNY